MVQVVMFICVQPVSKRPGKLVSTLEAASARPAFGARWDL
jgi:hypothetical protein